MAQITEEQELLEALEKMYHAYNGINEPFEADYADEITFYADMSKAKTKDFNFIVDLSKNKKIVLTFSVGVRIGRPHELYIMFIPEEGQTVLPENFGMKSLGLIVYLIEKGKDTGAPHYARFVDIPEGIMIDGEPKESITWPVELEYAEIDNRTADLTSYDSPIVRPPSKYSGMKEYTSYASFSELKVPVVGEDFIITHVVNQKGKDVNRLNETIFLGVEYFLDQRQFAFYHIADMSNGLKFEKLSDDMIEGRELFDFLKANKVGYQTITQKYITDNILEIKPEQEIIQEKLLGIFRAISVKEFKTDYTDSIHFAHNPSGGMKHMYDVSFIKKQDNQLRPNAVMMTVAIGITDMLNELSVYFIPDTLISISQPPYFDELMVHFVRFMRDVFKQNDLNLDINGVFIPTGMTGYTTTINETIEPTLVTVVDAIFGMSTHCKLGSQYANNYVAVKRGTALSSQLYDVTFKYNKETMMFLKLEVSEQHKSISLAVRNPEASNHITHYYKSLLVSFAHHLYLSIKEENPSMVVDKMYYVIEIASGVTHGHCDFS